MTNKNLTKWSCESYWNCNQSKHSFKHHLLQIWVSSTVSSKAFLIYKGFEYIKKTIRKTSLNLPNLKQFSCKATIITCVDTIIKLPKEHCCRYVPGEAEARKIVAVIKETSLYTGNTDAISPSLAHVRICVQLSMPKKLLHQNTQSPTLKTTWTIYRSYFTRKSS